MKALIVGAGGQLGSDLRELLADWDLHAPTHGELDVTDDGALAKAFETAEPEVVFNCSAFHNVDVCEVEEDRAAEVNVRAVKRMAQRSTEAGAAFVHVSTNYVFNGRAERPYVESDLPNPRSVYAITKLAGEYAALTYCERSLVVRTAGLYGMHGSASKGGNFVTRMLGRAREQGQLKMVADQHLTPTSTADLAKAVVAAVGDGQFGLAHITNSGSCSWYEFTEEIMRNAGVDVPIERGETSGLPERPLNGVLATERDLPELPSWQDALRTYMDAAELSSQ